MYPNGGFFISRLNIFILDSNTSYSDIVWLIEYIFILSCDNFDDFSKNILFIDENVKHGYKPSNVSRGVENLLTMPSNPQCLFCGKRWTPFQFTLVVFIFLVLFNEYFIYVFQTMRWPNVPDINRYVLIYVLRFYFSCIYYCDNQTITITCWIAQLDLTRDSRGLGSNHHMVHHVFSFMSYFLPSSYVWYCG